MTRRCAAGGLVLTWMLLCAGGGPAASRAQPASPGPRLAGFWSDWLADTGPLLAAEERLYFQILEDDRAREAFVEAFWQSRGTAALERWRRNTADARRLRSRSRARERVVRLAGKPDTIETIQRCGALRRLEIWSWQPGHPSFHPGSPSEPQYLIFVEATTLKMSSFEPWRPGDFEGLVRGVVSSSTIDGLIEALGTSPCISGDALARLSIALERAISVDRLRQLAPWPEPGTEWLRALRDVDPAAAGSGASLRLGYPGAFTHYTILHGEVEVPVARLTQLVPEQIFDRVTIIGDAYRGSRLVDSFEIVHHVAGAAPGDRLTLDFYRRLEPGPHRLLLRVADRDGIALLREALELEVPALAQPAPEPAGRSAGLSRLTRAELVQLNTLPSVELLPAVLDARGRQVIRAITTGGPIAAVEFRLAGAPVAIDDRPPYLLEIEPVVVETLLTAVALDPARRPLAEDVRELGPPNRPFAVRFGAIDRSARRVAVTVSLPEGEEVAGFECRHGRRVVRRASVPPGDCPLPESALPGAEYLTVEVTLASGDSQEDVLFLGPRAPERVDVRLAELYLTILDPGGRPARGLGSDDVRVWEAGKPRPVARLEPVEKLPLNVAVLMDISSSMGRALPVAVESAREFFDGVLTGDDLASLLAFNHDLHLLVPFTGDAAALRYGAAGLKAWGATRLHDAMVYALFQFSGLTSRRALIVLSDGSDVGSDFPLDQVVHAAERAAVAVYPISIVGTGALGSNGLEGLAALASATGGRFFRVAGASQLADVYRQIEAELRGQYLLVYEPGGTAELELPPVEVEVLRTGFRAREVRRYY